MVRIESFQYRVLNDSVVVSQASVEQVTATSDISSESSFWPEAIGTIICILAIFLSIYYVYCHPKGEFAIDGSDLLNQRLRNHVNGNANVNADNITGTATATTTTTWSNVIWRRKRRNVQPIAASII